MLAACTQMDIPFSDSHKISMSESTPEILLARLMISEAAAGVIDRAPIVRTGLNPVFDVEICAPPIPAWGDSNSKSVKKPARIVNRVQHVYKISRTIAKQLRCCPPAYGHFNRWR